MSNRKLTNVLLAILVIFNIVFVSSWWFGHWRAHRKMERMNYGHFGHESKGAMFLVKELNLDQAQQTQLEALRNNHFNKIQILESAVARNEKSLMKAMMANPADSAHAFLYADSIGMLRATMQKELFRHFNNIRKMCNPEQSKKFDELMGKMCREFPHHLDMHSGDGTKHDSM